MKIRQLTDEYLDELLEDMGITKEQDLDRVVYSDRVLTSSYVNQFNRGVSYRVRQREVSHQIGVSLADEVYFD